MQFAVFIKGKVVKPEQPNQVAIRLRHADVFIRGKLVSKEQLAQAEFMSRPADVLIKGKLVKELQSAHAPAKFVTFCVWFATAGNEVMLLHPVNASRRLVAPLKLKEGIDVRELQPLKARYQLVTALVFGRPLLAIEVSFEHP